MRLLLPSLVLLSILGSAEAIVIRHDREPGLYAADSSRFPSLFALYQTKDGYPDCVATLIAPSWALTAAHCTESDALRSAESETGYPVQIAGKSVLIDRVIRHEVAGKKADLALLHLSKPVQHVAPTAIYQNADELGRIVLFPGWGDTGDGVNGVTGGDGVFRIAENRVDAVGDGWIIFRFDDPRSRIDRALDREGISGPGDSGGPALVMTPDGLRIVGVSSRQRTFGRKEGLYGAEEYYVRLSDFVGWLKQVMSEPEPP